MKRSRTRPRLFVLLCAVVFLAAACTTAPEPPAGFQPEVLPLPAEASDYAPISSYAAMDIPADNPMTAEKVALGRQLFFDQRLSGDGERSCYGCHENDKGLSDGRNTALGAFDRVLSRLLFQITDFNNNLDGSVRLLEGCDSVGFVSFGGKQVGQGRSHDLRWRGYFFDGFRCFVGC